MAGCDTRPPRVASRESAAVTAPDTIVRRVLRVTPRASAMQRATGVLQAARALEPLDSILIVRVFDQRGREMRGVTVRWTLANAGDGADLRVINGVTDSLGLSRAAFTPGRSADAQSAVAEVANVGRIDFTVTIPAASIRILPERITLWSGEDSILATELKDDRGRVLPGGTLSWATPDTAALRVRTEDAAHGRVTAVLAGSAKVVAWVGAATLRDTAYVTVRPVIAGEFVTLDGQPPPQMRMEVLAPSVRESIPVQDGKFAIRVALPPDVEVDVRASAVTDTLAYHRVLVEIGEQHDLQRLVVSLVPRTWRIDAGSYAGRVLPIDAARAMQRSGKSAPFWRLVPNSGTGPRKLLGWRQSDLPLRIAFDRSRSSEPIAAEDSIRFWDTAAQMERDLGASLFAPAEMRGDTNRVNLVGVEISAQESSGHTFVSWSQPGDASDGVMLFRNAATLRNPHVVTHELLHLLGFGHSSAWPTISEPVGGTVQRLTPEDVAYAQVAMRLRRLQEATGARPGLPVARQ